MFFLTENPRVCVITLNLELGKITDCLTGDVLASNTTIYGRIVIDLCMLLNSAPNLPNTGQNRALIKEPQMGKIFFVET